MAVPVHQHLSISHRFFYHDWSLRESKPHLIVASREGEVTEITHDFETNFWQTDTGLLSAISVSKDGSLLASSSSCGIDVIQLADKTLERRFPDPYENAAISFSNCADRFWIARREEKKFLIEVFDRQSWKRLASTEIEDPYCGSSASFYKLPEMSQPSYEQTLWLAAGQNGIQLIFLRYVDHEIQFHPPLSDVSPVSVSPSLNAFCVAGGSRFRQFGYPDLTQTGECVWPDDNTVDDSVGYYSNYIDETKAILKTQELRILKADMRTMEVTGDLLLDREDEPQHSALDAGRSYYADLSYFFKFGSSIVTANRRHDEQRKTKYSLTFYRIEDILADW